GVAFIRNDKKIGIINTSGKTVLEPTYEVIKNFHHGYAKFKDGDKWGILDKNGKIVVPAEYDEIGTYSAKGNWAKKGDQWGVLNNGKFTEVSGAEKIYDFPKNSNLTYARKDGKMGFINAQGKWVIEPQYDKARAFNAGIAP